MASYLTLSFSPAFTELRTTFETPRASSKLFAQTSTTSVLRVPQIHKLCGSHDIRRDENSQLRQLSTGGNRPTGHMPRRHP